MKNNILNTFGLFLLLSLVSGCQVIGDIFKTGVGVGVFIAVVVVIIVIVVISKAKGN